MLLLDVFGGASTLDDDLGFIQLLLDLLGVSWGQDDSRSSHSASHVTGVVFGFKLQVIFVIEFGIKGRLVLQSDISLRLQCLRLMFKSKDVLVIKGAWYNRCGHGLHGPRNSNGLLANGLEIRLRLINRDWLTCDLLDSLAPSNVLQGGRTSHRSDFSRHRRLDLRSWNVRGDMLDRNASHIRHWQATRLDSKRSLSGFGQDGRLLKLVHANF